MMSGFFDLVNYDRWIVHALLLVPVLGAMVVAVGPARLAKRVALGVALLEFVISAGLWWAFVPDAGMQFVSAAAWIPGWGIQYAVGIDGISLFMVLLSTLLMPLCVLGSWRYIEQRERAYYALLLVLTTGMLGVFVALDVFLFYVAWELVLIPMYFLIGIWGGERRLYAAIKFFVYTMLGSVLMLVAILWMYSTVGRATGVYSFDYQHFLVHAPMAGRAGLWLFAAFALAFAIKVPVFPFHTWLPDAHVEAPTAASVLLAAVLLKMGTYGFLRFAVPFFPEFAMAPGVRTVVLWLAVVGIVYGALVAMVQPDLKKLVAYSSVSHLGFVMLGIWALTVQGVQGALLVMINHGFSTGALFFLVGMLYERRHSREIAAYGGIARAVPLLAVVFTIVSLSSIGLPGTNGFVGEFLVLVGAWAPYPWATAVAVTGVIFAAAYLLWALQRVFLNRLDVPDNEHLPDLSLREAFVLVPLLAGIFWIGLYPKPVLERMEPAAREFVRTTAHRAGAQLTGAAPMPTER